MKGIKLLKGMRDYFGSSQILIQAQITEAIAELEALQQRNCEGCRADCSVKDALNTHGQYWDYPSDIGCKSRYEAKEK